MNLYIHNAPSLTDNELINLREKLANFSQQRISRGICVGSMQSLLEAFVAYEFADLPLTPSVDKSGYEPKDIVYNVLTGQFSDPGRSPPVIHKKDRQEELEREILQQIANDVDNRINSRRKN